MAPGADPTESLDLRALSTWMDGQQLPGGEISDARLIPGGTQNVLLRFERGGRTYVFRRGPWNLRRTSNEAIRREIRVLGALGSTPVPHPRLVAGCPDEGVLDGAAFLLMELVDGFVPAGGGGPEGARKPEFQHRMGYSVVEAIASLGDVDAAQVGLADLGQPDGFLERQVPRWIAELESYGTLDGYAGPEIPGLDDVARWLDNNRPASLSPGLMHGDFHLANVLIRHDGPEVAAIVDWEMCTLGDPLLDLGWLLATLPTVEDPGVGGALRPDGFPGPAELVDHYAAVSRSGRDLSAMAWYEVLACFKLGIVLEGTYARAQAGKAPMAVGEMLHATTLNLFRRANRRIAAA